MMEQQPQAENHEKILLQCERAIHIPWCIDEVQRLPHRERQESSEDHIDIDQIVEWKDVEKDSI